MDLVLATGITIIIFIATLFIPIKDEISKTLINSIPVAIPTIMMWVKVPKNYLKFMCFKSINIEYQIDIRIQNCSLDQSYFYTLRNNLVKLDQSNKARIIKENIGDELMISLMDIDTALVDLQYHISEQTLFIKSRSKIKYKLFFELAKDFLLMVDSTFKSNKDIYYDDKDLTARLKIEFIEKNREKSKIDASNPFWNKLFSSFKSKIVDFRYKTSNNNSVLISNDSIEFIGDNLTSLSLDIKKELTFLGIRN